MPIQLDQLRTDVHLDRLNILIDGAQASEAVMRDLLDCSVENSLHLPDLCSIRLFLDEQFTWMENNTFALGKEIQIQVGSESETLKPIFWGEITTLEMDLVATGVPTMVVRALDKSHRLQTGRFQRTFINVKDSDIVTQLANECELEFMVDETAQVHRWVCQNNQTNWEFLQDRAARIGYRLYSSEGYLNFAPISDTGTAQATTRWGSDLRSFRVRTCAGSQVTEVEVRGWNPQTKETIIGKAKSTPRGMPRIDRAGMTDPGAVAQKAFGTERRMVVVDRPVTTQEEANTVAKSLTDEIGQSYIEADGVCSGSALIKAGEWLRVEEVGKSLTGEYFLTATTHVYTPAEGYTTLFSISGMRANTVLALLGGGVSSGASGLSGGGADGRTHPQGGNIAVGIVTDNADPDGLARIKVRYPHLSDSHASDWARLSSPMAGKERGFEFIPEIGDEVLVAFEHGDIHRPYVLGGLWNGSDKPKELSNDGKVIADGLVQRRVIYSRIGHRFVFDDSEEKGWILIQTKAENRILLSDADRAIQIRTTDRNLMGMSDADRYIHIKTTDGRSIRLDDAGKTMIFSDPNGNKITIDSNAGSIAAQCNGTFSISAGGKVTIEGQQGVEITTPMEVKIEGTAGVSATSTAQTNIEGTQVVINGSGMTEIKGGLVTIN